MHQQQVQTTIEIGRSNGSGVDGRSGNLRVRKDGIAQASTPSKTLGASAPVPVLLPPGGGLIVPSQHVKGAWRGLT